MYETLLSKLKAFLVAVETLSKGYLPMELFPVSQLTNMTKTAINMVRMSHPDYVLAITKITHYYDVKLVTFAVDKEGDLVMVFPTFVQSYNKRPLSLYEIETAKVPILDKNTQADSYTEVQVFKPYITINNDYYIQLRIQELQMCKMIHLIYFCEELFLVKHKTKHSCESAIFYKLGSEVIRENCNFKYYYNETVIPSVLDGGSQIVLANMINKKKLSCSDNFHLAKPLPEFNYVLVNRSILCKCRIEGDLTYILQSIGSCSEPTESLTLYFTANLAFAQFMHEILNLTGTLNDKLTTTPQLLNISLGKFQGKDGKLIPSQPDSLKNFQNCYLQFNRTFGPNIPGEGLSQPKVEFWLTKTFKVLTFCLAITSILLLLPIIRVVIKQKKLKTLVAAMALHRVPTAMLAPINSAKKTTMVCQYPWVSFLLTAITAIGLIMYFWKFLRQTHLWYGFKFNNYCSLYFYFCNTCYFVPIKVADAHGRLHQFSMENRMHIDSISPPKCLTWDSPY